ncbi:crossover junction endodeoxyribonuclease RuvC [Candidatus Nomurabacteria bacterium]|nr:crossover junction endodeoxyribonuclease RuvC [Candidatus Nomurabacteria bacterium]
MSFSKEQKIIAIDPGYDRCGVAVVGEISGKPDVLFSVCITSNKSDEQYLRLTSIFKQLEDIIEKYKPNYLAIETLFFSVNKKTAIKVAEARGSILTLAGLKNLSIIELSPQAIKLALTGQGNASKDQVKKMVNLTIKNVNQKIDDEIDAIAIGIAAIQEIKLNNLKKGLAK